MNKKINMAGFTIIEIVVALLIVGLALVALSSQSSYLLRVSGKQEETVLAFWVGENTLTEMLVVAQLTQWPDVGREEKTVGMADRVWDVLAEVSDTDNKNLRRVDVKVNLHQEGIEISDNLEPIVILTGFVGHH